MTVIMNKRIVTESFFNCFGIFFVRFEFVNVVRSSVSFPSFTKSN